MSGLVVVQDLCKVARVDRLAALGAYFEVLGLVFRLRPDELALNAVARIRHLHLLALCCWRRLEQPSTKQ
jgi:hypothetical protein